MARARLKLLAKAREDMIHLRRYSRREFGAAAADRLVDDIERAFLLLEELNVPPDFPLELVPLQFEQPPLLLELLLEALQGWKRHVGLNALQ